jgi:hypothetical protein
MTTMIIRVYETAQQATDAVAMLKQRRFAGADIDSLASDTPDPVGALVTAGVPAKSAEKFAEYLRKGCTAVVVRAPYGQSFTAIKALSGFKPLDVEVETEHFEGSPGFLSDVLGIPLLLKGEPTTSLLDDRTVSEWFHIPTVVHWKPFSGLISGTIGSKIGLPEILKK